MPLPTRETTDLSAPSLAETRAVLRGVVSAVRTDAGLTEVQQLLIAAVFHAMTGHTVEPATAEPVSADELASTMATRDLAFRTRVVQIMLLGELVLTPLPAAVCDRVRGFAAALEVDDAMIDVAEAYATGALDVAAADFARNGYLAALDPERLSALHVSALAQPWEAVTADDGLAARWTELESLPVGTLGRGVVDFYRDRGFVYPGRPGSAPPLLAQHDWVHVLANYGTTLENELEVFALMARADDDPRAFSLLAMVVSLFETGYLAAGAGLFEADPGHLTTSGVPARVADAMLRGALVEGSHDFLDTDWFALADRPLSVVRGELRLPPKAVASPGPWEDGGITAYQLRAARRQAADDDRAYVPWKPDPARV